MKRRQAVYIILWTFLLVASACLAKKPFTPMPEEGERWYKVVLQGSHAGWANEKFFTEERNGENTWVVESAMHTHFIWETVADLNLRKGRRSHKAPQLFTIVIRQQVDLKIVYDKDGLYSSYYVMKEQGRMIHRVRIKRTPSGYVVEGFTEEGFLDHIVTKESFDTTTNALMELAGRLKKPGDKVTVRELELATGRVNAATYNVTGTEKRKILGKNRTLRIIQKNIGGSHMKIRLDETGRETGMFLGGSGVPLSTLQAGKEEAKDFEPPRIDLDAGDQPKSQT